MSDDDNDDDDDDDDVPILKMVAKRKAKRIARRSTRNRGVDQEEEEEEEVNEETSKDEKESVAPRRRRSLRIKSPVFPKKDESYPSNKKQQFKYDLFKDSSDEDDAAPALLVGDNEMAVKTESNDQALEKPTVANTANDDGNVGNDRQHDQQVETPRPEDISKDTDEESQIKPAAAVDSKGGPTDKVGEPTGIADMDKVNVTSTDMEEVPSVFEEKGMEQTNDSVADDSAMQVEDPTHQEDEPQKSLEKGDSQDPAVDPLVVGTIINVEQGEPGKLTVTVDVEAPIPMEIDSPEQGLNSSNDQMATSSHVEDPTPQEDEPQKSLEKGDSQDPTVDEPLVGTINVEQGEPGKSTVTVDVEAPIPMEIETPEQGLNSSNDQMAAASAETSADHGTKSTAVVEQPVVMETAVGPLPPSDILTLAPLATTKRADPQVLRAGEMDTIEDANPIVGEAIAKTALVEQEVAVGKSSAPGQDAPGQDAVQTLPNAADPSNDFYSDKDLGPRPENSSLTQTQSAKFQSNDSTKLLQEKSALVVDVVDDKTVQASLESERMLGDPLEADSIADETPKSKESTSDQDSGTAPMDLEPIGEEKQEDKVNKDRHDGASINAETKKTIVNEEPHLDKEPGATVSKAPWPVTVKPPTEEETAAVLDVFPDMIKRKQVRGTYDKRPKKRRREAIHIKISGIPKARSDAILPEINGDNAPSNIFSDAFFQDIQSFSGAIIPESEIEGVSSRCEHELEDSLAFFSETHEEQDPVFIEFQKEKEKRKLMDELIYLKKQHEAGVVEINENTTFQMREKQASADRNIERFRKNAAIEGQRDLHRLRQVYEEKAVSNNNKISHGTKLLTKRQAEDMQKAHLRHRQQSQQRGIPEQVATAEWQNIAQRLQEKQNLQLAEFTAKGEEVKKKFDAEYQREKEKYIQHHEKRKRDIEQNMQKVISRMRSTFQQQHQLYLRRHAMRIKERRDDILLRLGEKKPAETDLKDSKEATSEPPELRAPSPVRLCIASDVERKSGSPGAATRLKHRKSILSSIHKQLSVEIHNEGLWISTFTEKNPKGEGEKRKTEVKDDGEFIPWSVKARTVLQSIVVGEIPVGYGTDRFDFGEAVQTQGGLIRCVVVDLRTSEETASAQRAAAVKDHEALALMELEQTAQKLSEAAAVAERNSSKAMAEEQESTALHENTLKDVEKAKDMMQQLRTKFKRVLTPDDVPVPNMTASDRTKLSLAISKYSGNLETAQLRQKTAELSLNDKKVRTQKMLALAKQAQKVSATAVAALRKKRSMQGHTSRSNMRLSDTAEAERAATRVADVIAVLHKTAEGRREQLNQKRSSSASSTWVQSLPRLSGALKKGLWHKMHRRVQQIVLRPSMDFVLGGLKQSVEESAQSSKERFSITREESMQRAEALFLLSAYPATDSEAPSVPPSSSSATWAEPGWHVNLNVPKDTEGGLRSLLPRAPSFPVMQKNHSEYCSAPGRQMASLIGTTHFRALTTPLSAVAQAISLAETSPVATGTEMAESDPLQMSEAAMMAGYTFTVKSATKWPTASHARKKPATKDEAEVAVALSPARQPVPSALAEPKKSPWSIPSRRASMAKTEKRRRAKSTSGASPRAKAPQKMLSSDAAFAAAAAADETQARNYIQQQAAANVLGVRAMQPVMQYGQQPQQQPAPQARMDQQSYSPSFLTQQVQAPSPLQQQQLQVPQMSQQLQPQQMPQHMQQQLQPQQMSQQLQPQQMQQQMPQQMSQQMPQQMSQQMSQQQQLLSQQPYASPQFRGQIAQMRMMQPGFPQQSMRFFAPPMARQTSYGNVNQQQPPMQLPRQPPQQQHQQQQQQRSPEQQGGDPNDPLFMLPDMQ